MNHDYDVVVIGGGPAGSAAATVLATAGRSVAILERSAYGAMRIGETLPPQARALLQELNVYDEFQKAGHVSSPGIVSAWGSAEPYANDFIVNPYGNGWHVDRARFDRMLARHAVQCGASLYEDSAVATCELHAQGWSLALRSPRHPSRINGRFVIDATGRRVSPLKRRAGARAVHDRLIGVAAYLPSRANDVRTLIEAAPDGWWYACALPHGQLCVYMTDADLVPANRATLKALLSRKLEDAPLTRARLGSIEGTAQIRVFAAMTRQYRQLHGDNWLLAGDAAATWDPLSGRGICNALESGVGAAAAIDRALGGDPSVLTGYSNDMNAGFAGYLHSRAKYYRAEQRWPDSPFWRRRHAVN